MVCHVFVQVCQNQQEFEHAVPLVRIGLGGAFFEILYHGERVREQPLDVSWAHRLPFAAPAEHQIRSKERFVEKVIEA